MSYYAKHVFICTNLRADGRRCCANADTQKLLTYAKTKIKALQCNGKVRINTAGCMDRCDEGPVLVVYPEGVWYRYESQADIEEILNEHILHGRRVERLLLNTQ